MITVAAVPAAALSLGAADAVEAIEPNAVATDAAITTRIAAATVLTIFLVLPVACS